MADLARALTAVMLTGWMAGCGLTQQEPGRGPAVPEPISPVQQAVAAPEHPDSDVIADFNARLEKYITVQRALLKGAPISENATPEQILARQQTLAAELRAIRKDAKHGDIFTPQVAALFKRLMAPEFKGKDGQETKVAIVPEADEAPKVWLRVNADYPQDQPRSTVPPNILERLPQLPPDVEYRFVGRHLLLRDVDANIIVDFIYNAIP